MAAFRPSDYTVLFLEEDPEIMKIVDPLLREAGFRVLTAVSTEECLERYLDHPGNIDILVGTINEVDSRRLYDRMKIGRPRLKVLWLLVKQGYAGKLASVGFYDRAYTTREMDYTHKPFGQLEIVARITALVEKR